MAHREKPKLQSILLLRKLKQVTEKGGDNTEFFYLYVSTAGVEQRRKPKRTQPHLEGQQHLPFTPQRNRTDPVDDDNTDSDQDDNQDDSTSDQNLDIDAQFDEIDEQEDGMDDQSRQGSTNIASSSSQPSAASLLSRSLTQDKIRQEAMIYVHNTILPLILEPEGWKKVVDKDTKLTYRALYFNIIKKHPGEDVQATYIPRVGMIRHKIAKKVQELKDERQVNFKINSLLSKPFLYDEEALAEQTMRATQTQPPGMKQRTLDDYQ